MSRVKQEKAMHPKVTLKRALEASIRGGHPWVFRDAIQPFPSGVKTGDVADLMAMDGSFVARGVVEIDSPLAFRAWTIDPNQPVDQTLLNTRLTRAYAARKSVMSPAVTGYRLCHGENDHIPGLHCDIYGDIASLRTDGGLGAAWESRFVDAVKTVAKPSAIVVRNTKDKAPRVVHGTLPDEVIIHEGDRRFRVDLLQGQKTGFFLDQRENRDRVAGLSAGLRVLNLFSYTGGFSVAAALAGARRVVSVDIAAPAIESARENFILNGIDPTPHGFEAADVFDVLESMVDAKPQYDLIVLDPPSFARNRKSLERGLRAYTALNTMAFKSLPPGGLLATASCSSHVSPSAFLDMVAQSAISAQRETTVLGVYGAGMDHPTRLGFPHGQYLKFVLLRVH
jgi:23S rRNA (cytosine1962-C5)-methyltransferase